MNTAIKTKITLLIILGIFTSLAFFVLGNKPKENQVCFDSSCFKVSLADTPKEREIGLMGVENLDVGSGMLFIFEREGFYDFWMKNTLISLDIIWINKEGFVVGIASNQKPCEENNCQIIKAKWPARYVLELNSGTVAKEDIKLGQKAEFLGELEKIYSIKN